MNLFLLGMWGWGLIGALVLSILPFMGQRKICWYMFLPFMILILYVLYEVVMPIDMNIRVDLLAIVPLVFASLLVGLWRWGSLLVIRTRLVRSEGSHIRVLILPAVMSLLLLCALIGWMHFHC